MTAEERMAYFQGEMKRNHKEHVKNQEKNWSLILLKIKFFIAVILFVVFLSLDYTGYKVLEIGSEEIIQYVISDIDFLKTSFAYIL